METVMGVFATRERGSPGAANQLERFCYAEIPVPGCAKGEYIIGAQSDIEKLGWTASVRIVL